MQREPANIYIEGLDCQRVSGQEITGALSMCDEEDG